MTTQSQLPVDLPPDRLTEKQARRAVDDYVARNFIENEYGIWCPNCQESIDMFWPESCGDCGWPKKDYDRYDDDSDFDRDSL